MFKKMEKISLLDTLLVSLTDFACMVDQEDLDLVRKMVQKISEYKIILKKEKEDNKKWYTF